MGRADPLVGLSRTGCSRALTTQTGAILMNAAGNRTFYDKPEVIEALQYWVDLVAQAQGASARHRRMGHDAEGLLRAQGRHDVDHHRQPDQREEQREIPVRRRDAARAQAARQPDRRRQLLHLQEGERRPQQAAAFKFIKWITTPERAAQWSIDTGYVAVRADAYGHAGDEEIRRRTSRPPRSRATSCKFAVAELSTHDNQRVTKALNDGLQAALTGTKTPEQAMKDAQARGGAACCAAVSSDRAAGCRAGR